MAKNDSPSRGAGGRPLYYTLPGGDGFVTCFICLRNGLQVQHRARNALWNDPDNSPGDAGSVYTVCRHHVPENAVIYDRTQDRCYDRAGNPIDI